MLLSKIASNYITKYGNKDLSEKRNHKNVESKPKWNR